ncbi:RNA-directed DNA polymerase (Reverse transcriptase) [Trifolium medium]|uniref:RNA-directed DNA polymerase (Reverse transcriptase) n=1 Tax=Trifolium medium TaxID=97028 RepID=A0A392QDB4_9FABA|nr:RNA-directed DNA polymerase (Reverse transcriptase) [Trifolium medium]
MGRIRQNEERDWCSEIVNKKLGNGGDTRFWLDIWVGTRPLCQVFPRLFSVSLQTHECINQVGEWRNEEWYWNFKCRRRFFVWEDELLTQLMEVIGEVIFSRFDDSWVCAIGDDGGYTVKDGYRFLSDNFSPVIEVVDSLCRVLKRVWKKLSSIEGHNLLLAIIATMFAYSG